MRQTAAEIRPILPALRHKDREMNQRSALFPRILHGFPLAFVSVLLLSACSMSLAADVTPPPDYQPPNPPPASSNPSTSPVPILPPDPVNGQSIYQDKCAPCHGQTGMGNGEMASNLSSPPTLIGQPEIAHEAVPSAWFEIVTQGRIQKMMPGFVSLSDRQRWDVVAYAITLHSTPADLEAAKKIYTVECATCHGSDGSGPPDWRSPARLTPFSEQALYDTITSGVDARKMPAFKDQFSDQQRWQLAAYVRTLGFSRPVPALTASTQPTESAIIPTPTGASPTQVSPATTSGLKLNISGLVSFPDSRPLPDGLQVELQGFTDTMKSTFDLKMPVGASGRYRFVDVDFDPKLIYVVLVDYQGLSFFNSTMDQAQKYQPGSEVDLPIKLYDTTTNATRLSAQRLHIFFDFSKPNTLQVAELFIISNPGDRVVIPARSGDPVLAFKLPEGASNLQFQNGRLSERFVQLPDGFGDTSNIFPGTGSHQVLFAYEIPYNARETLLKLDLPLPVESVMAAVPSNGVNLSSPQLAKSSERDVEGTKITAYSSGSLPSGSQLVIDLYGSPITSAESSAATSKTELAVGLGAFGLVCILIAILFYRRQKPESSEKIRLADEEDSEETLLDAIIALDDRFQAGELGEAAYHERRAELKERLRELIESPADQDGNR
jgi:mono/diheme cytochrome c family protein